MSERPAADICLLLEGTYPFVAGGVSGWVHEIIRGFPDYRFALVFIGSRAEDYGAMKYTLPDNVVHLEQHYLFDPGERPRARPCEGEPSALERVHELHGAFRSERELGRVFGDVIGLVDPEGMLSERVFLHSRRPAWEFVVDQYRTRCTDPSFVDYFWTVRTMHMPIWRLAEAARRPYPARAYHTISTGYAGLLGAMLHARTGRPLILSEHGIYTKERKIDLFKASWVKDNRSIFDRAPTEVGYLKELWIRFYEKAGKICYESAAEIIALYEANRQRQIRDGAPAERTSCIPNGIDVERYRAKRRRPEDPVPAVLCLIGRVVPIKDIKTFIRAMRSVANRMPEAEGWIVGPEDEDPDYARECHALVAGLGLEHQVKFLGFQRVDELLPRCGVVVLSSMSEALPLVVLEGFAAGVPALCTDVGSCRQLVYGNGEEDSALGAAGRIVGISDPAAFAEAGLELLTDAAAWRVAHHAAVARVERYYDRRQMFERYAAVYDRTLGEEEDGRDRL